MNYWRDEEAFTLYHGTSKDKAKSILISGLVPSDKGYTKGYTYMTTSERQAWWYAEIGGEVEHNGHATIPGDEQVVLIVECPTRCLIPTSYWLKTKDRFDLAVAEVPSDQLMGEFKTAHVIDPIYIQETLR